MLEREANLDSGDYDILTLTRLIAMGAGYHRSNRVFKNGAVRKCTSYNKPFDSVLSAKWIIFYRKWFISELKKRADLVDKQVEIINNTFLMFMSYMDLDKLKSPAAVTKYVKSTLAHRIRTASFGNVTPKKLEKFHAQTVKQRREKVILHQKDIINSTSISYDGYLTNHPEEKFEETHDDDAPTEDLVLDIRHRLRDNPYGEKVLESLLYSDRQVSLKSVNYFISVEESEKTPETKKYIRDAYNIIKNTLRSYVQKPYMYDWSDVTLSRINFAGENK